MHVDVLFFYFHCTALQILKMKKSVNVMLDLLYGLFNGFKFQYFYRGMDFVNIYSFLIKE